MGAERQGSATSPDEQEGFVHRFLPSADPSPRLTLLLLHGTGGSEDDLLQLGHELSPEAALLSPRGRVLENGMPRFFRRLAEGVFDLDDLVLRTHELADFVKTASVKYSLASGSVVAVGYSNGANIAASLVLLHPKVLAGAVLFRPMVPLIPRELPDLSSVRILVAGGASDRLVRRDQTEGLVNLFNRCHAHVAVHWERATHFLAEGDVHTAREWLSENFGGSAPSSQGHRI